MSIEIQYFLNLIRLHSGHIRKISSNKFPTISQHFVMQSFSSICENIPHLEYSRGQSFTSVKIHVTTCDGEL